MPPVPSRRHEALLYQLAKPLVNEIGVTEGVKCNCGGIDAFAHLLNARLEPAGWLGSGTTRPYDTAALTPKYRARAVSKQIKQRYIIDFIGHFAPVKPVVFAGRFPVLRAQ